MRQPERQDATRERVLDAAEELFAERGYHGVSVREITNAAGSNLSAINYYFGSKKNLYLEVFRSRWIARARKMQESFRAFLRDHEPLTVEDVVEALARAFLEGPFSDEDRQRHAHLMIREMAKPSEALELVADQVMRPFFSELAGLLGSVSDGDLERESLMLNILSMFATVLYFNFARTAVSRITGRTYDREFKARLVRQITEFSLTGLGGLGKEAGR